MEVIQRAGLRRVATIDFRANQVVREHIPISGKIRSFFLRLTGTQTHTDVTAVQAINRNPATLVPSLTFYLNRDEVYKQGRFLDWVDRMPLWRKAAPNTAVGALAQAYPFKTSIRVPCQTPWGRYPMDTHLDMDAWDRLDIEVQWGDTPQVATATATSFAVTPKIDVLADIVNDDREEVRPQGLYKELAFDAPPLLAVSNTDLQVELTLGPTRRLHSIILVAEDDPGAAERVPVSTAMNKIRLQQSAAFGQSLLYGLASGDECQEEADDLLATDAGVQTGVYPILFQPRYDGLSSFNVYTDQLDDLRLLIDHDAFDTAGYLRVLEQIVEPL